MADCGFLALEDVASASSAALVSACSSHACPDNALPCAATCDHACPGDTPPRRPGHILDTKDLNELIDLIGWSYYLEVKNEEKPNGLLP